MDTDGQSLKPMHVFGTYLTNLKSLQMFQGCTGILRGFFFSSLDELTAFSFPSLTQWLASSVFH